MASDTFLDTDQTSENRTPVRHRDDIAGSMIAALSDRSRSLRTMLLRELHFARTDYRTLALHAGPSDRITLDAKQLVTRLSALLQAELERPRREDAEQPG